MAFLNIASLWPLAAEEHAEPNVLPFDLDLAIFSLLVFLGLAFILGRYAWRPILDGLAKREKRISDQIDSAQQANDQAQAKLREYELRLAKASDEAAAMLAQARQEAAKAKDQIVAEANAEARRQRERAITDIQAAKNQALRELAEHSVDSAVTLAGSLVGKEIDRNTHNQLIRESLDRFVQTG